MKQLPVAILLLASIFSNSNAVANQTTQMAINQADTLWLLISTALVMLMIPGLGLFYGGMVRRKNVLSTMKGCLVGLYVVGLQWILFGYSLAFGPDKGGLIGDDRLLS